MIRPRALKAGSKVAVVAPSSPYNPEDLDRGLEVLRGLGLDPVRLPGGEAGQRLTFLAGPDELRARALNEALGDPELEAVFCARGGYGSARLLGLLDLPALGACPKVFMGFSDITALLLPLWSQSGCVVFHGPTVCQMGQLGGEEGMSFWGLVGPQGRPPAFEGLTPLCPGVAEGEVVGGNLSVLTSLLGTPFFPDLEGKVLFFEEVGEQPYRVDRMLTQVLQSQRLRGVRAVMVGQIMGRSRGSLVEAWRDVLVDRLGQLGVPAVMGLPAGHGRVNRAFPIGVRAFVNGEEGKVVFSEAGTDG